MCELCGPDPRPMVEGHAARSRPTRRDVLRHTAYLGAAAVLARPALAALADLVSPAGALGAESAAGSTGLGGGARAAGVSIVPPRIVTRAEWGADEALRTGAPTFAPLVKGIVHHTATPSNPPDPHATLRAILRDHTQSNGWNDIGYNFIVDAAGTAYEGRWARGYAQGEVHSGESLSGGGVVGAHAAGFNTGSVGICLIGTFTEKGPTEAAMSTLVQLLAWKFGPREIDPHGGTPYQQTSGAVTSFSNIGGHRDVVPTACPGNVLHGLLPSIRDRVAARLRGGLVGYRALAFDGGVKSVGDVADLGDLPRLGVHTATRSIASTPAGGGFWLLGTDGGVFAFGDAAFHGSLPGLGVRTAAADLVATRSGAGYWVLGADGGIFAFGDAAFHGSVPGAGVRTTVLKMASTPSGKGYWVLGTDGGVFAFGDAGFYGSLPGLSIRTPVTDLAPTPSGRGYWLLGADGGVFAFGDARFFGSIPGLRVSWSGPARAIVPTPTGEGYLVLASDGGVFAFGDAPFLGSAVSLRKVTVDLAAVLAPAA